MMAYAMMKVIMFLSEGRKAKCNFYDYVREKTKKLTTDSETQKVKGKWKHYGLTLYREVWLDSIKCSCYKESFTYNPDDEIFKYCPYCGSKMVYS